MLHDPFEVPDKDPEFIYRWCNTDERAMLQRQAQGYEVVIDAKPELPQLNPAAAALTSGAGNTRRRGSDLVLCRIRRDVFDRTIEARRAILRRQHGETIDAHVERANDDVTAKLGGRYGSRARGLVFRSSDDATFPETNRG